MNADEFMGRLDLPEVYAAGGSVRDALLGRERKDADYLVRGASIAEIQAALKSHVGKGIRPLKLRDGRQVGLRMAVPGLGLLEITLPRKEVSIGPGHRDFAIVCDKNLTLAEDAARRDFTINALYHNVKTGDIIDPLGGREDLRQRLIRTTHPDSFRDDPLRILRGLRFVSMLGFKLEGKTYQQMHEHAKSVDALTLKGVSGTVPDELCKLLMGDHPNPALGIMRDTGVLSILLPELNSMCGFEQRSAYHDKSCDEHIFDAIQQAANLDAPLRVRLALLFHDAGKPWMGWELNGNKHYYALTLKQIRNVNAPPTAMFSHEWWGVFLADQALTRLNAPADLKRDVLTLIERHMLQPKLKRMKIRILRAELGDSLLADLILHRRCDMLSKGNDVDDALAGLQHNAEYQQQAIDVSVPRCVKDLAIKGKELVELGLSDPSIGEIQRQLLHEVMADESLNTREWLLSRAQRLAMKQRKERDSVSH